MGSAYASRRRKQKGVEAHHWSAGAPSATDKEYLEWEEADLLVFSWIVDNMEIDIVGDFAHHQSAKAMLESLVVTYQIRIWKPTGGPCTVCGSRSTAAKAGRPITCCYKGICQYRDITNQRRLYKFLAGLNPQYEGNQKRYSQGESDAFGRHRVRLGETGGHKAENHAFGEPRPNRRNKRRSVIGRSGLWIWSPKHTPFPSVSPAASWTADTNNRRGGNKSDKTKLWCSHCGMNKHTRETCFKLFGFPDWWEENQKGKTKLAIGVEENGVESNTRGRGAEGANLTATAVADGLRRWGRLNSPTESEGGAATCLVKDVMG